MQKLCEIYPSPQEESLLLCSLTHLQYSKTLKHLGFYGSVCLCAVRATHAKQCSPNKVVRASRDTALTLLAAAEKFGSIKTTMVLLH